MCCQALDGSMWWVQMCKWYAQEEQGQTLASQYCGKQNVVSDLPGL